MLKIPLATWIANAAVGLTGLYGDVTRQSQVADCSRQTIYDHAHKVQAAVVDAHDGGPTRAALIAENQRLAQENAQLWNWLAQTVEFPVIKQHEFVATAAAMGLSLDQVLVLLALILGEQACPGRSTLHRWVKLAGVAAGRVLKLLDARCRALVLVGCLDEIFFHGRPALVGRRARQHDLVPRAQGRRPHRGHLGQGVARLGWVVVRHRGRGQGPASRDRRSAARATGGGEAVIGERPGRVPHDLRGATRLASDLESRGTAVGASRGRQSPGQGVATARPGCPGPGERGESAWKQAEAAFAEYERSEAGWKIAHGALAVFGPEGRLNDRTWASQQIALALPLLSGREWSKVRGLAPGRGGLDVPGPAAPPVGRSGRR